jgi:hypothetical protein
VTKWSHVKPASLSGLDRLQRSYATTTSQPLMRRLRKQWGGLSTEAKLSIVVMPVVLAFLVGLVIPFIRDQLSDETTAKRSGVVKIIDVQEGVPLGDFAAQHAAAPQPRFVLAAATDDAPAIDAQQAAPADDGTDGDAAGTDDGGAGTTTDDGGDGTTTDGGTDGGGNDADGDGVADADDLCPTTMGNLASGCLAAYLRTEPYGCTEDDMARSLTSGEDGSQRCEDLGSVAGETTGGEPGDVEARADAVAAALNETQTVRGADGRLEPLGVAVTVRVTVTGLEGEDADVTWSLRHGDGGRLPHVWLRNRRVIKLTAEAESDSGSAEFWVPLPKRPRGPYFVRIGMYDEDGTPLTFENSGKIG